MDFFRALAPHPCQIRFGDLNRFVYLTKAERYDVLAQFMGFVPQVDFQKALRRVESKFRDTRDDTARSYEQVRREIGHRLSVGDLDENQFTTILRDRIRTVGVDCGDTLPELEAAKEILKERVLKDPVAKELSVLKELVACFAKISVPAGLLGDLISYGAALKPFRDQEEEFAKLLKLQLYRSGIEVLQLSDDKKTCPLCGHVFSGNLLEHVQQHADRLRELQESYVKIESLRKQCLGALRRTGSILDQVSAIKKVPGFQEAGIAVDELSQKASVFDNLIADLSAIVDMDSKEFDQQIVDKFKGNEQVLAKLAEELVDQIAGNRSQLQERISNNEGDQTRQSLVDVYGIAENCLSGWSRLESEGVLFRKLVNMTEEMRQVVEDYIKCSSREVEYRFNTISSNVTRYFEILEQRSIGIEHPVLRLEPGDDRAVSMEVIFHGEKANPAYKYLSESQLNSFGLAVFLASVREFNKEFKFVLLDDVINSFDAYKRPQVVKLLKNEFEDFQVIVLTHDEVWRDQICRSCPSWIRTELYGFTYERGPMFRPGLNKIERIEELLRQGRPEEAGRNLGVYMEQQLQDICDSFGAWIKYRKANDYTLDPLLEALRIRVKEKLTDKHPLYLHLQTAIEDSIFRNFCSHWKNPVTPYTASEVKSVVDTWVSIETSVHCQNRQCGELLCWNPDAKSFNCRCGKSVLTKL